MTEIKAKFMAVDSDGDFTYEVTTEHGIFFIIVPEAFGRDDEIGLLLARPTVVVNAGPTALHL